MNLIIEKIEWLKNRFLFKYKETESSQSISNVKEIINIFNDIKDMNIEEVKLDNILSKYYFGFTDTQEDVITKETDFNYGYTKEEKDKIRLDIHNIYQDILCSIVQIQQTPKEKITTLKDIDFTIEIPNE
jgi:hypothetical protein|tara:strand:- start:274 stop:663 length:390 start_codon:yes stop_codon:yes gene_type:complete